MHPVDATPDEVDDDVTPSAQPIPTPAPTASPIEWARYDVAVCRQEVKQATQRAGRRLGELERNMRKLIGEEGNNGKVGTLTAALGFVKRIGYAAMLIALGGVVSAAMVIYNAGGGAAAERIKLEQADQRSLSNQAQIEQLKNDLLRLRFSSAFPSTPSGAP